MAQPADLFELASRVRRLAPARSPHAFAAVTAQLAGEIEAVARSLGASPKPAAGRLRSDVVTIRGRRVLVQRRRAAFGIR